MRFFVCFFVEWMAVFAPAIKCSSSITSLFARSITALFIYCGRSIQKTKYVFNITLTRNSLVLIFLLKTINKL